MAVVRNVSVATRPVGETVFPANNIPGSPTGEILITLTAASQAVFEDPTTVLDMQVQRRFPGETDWTTHVGITGWTGGPDTHFPGQPRRPPSLKFNVADFKSRTGQFRDAEIRGRLVVYDHPLDLGFRVERL